jgi:uncharacterized damage-inducible protein DinB
MLDLIRDLYAHMEWADERLWRELLANSRASADDSVLDLLAHLHSTQHAFLDVWKGRDVKLRKRGDFSDAAEMAGWANRFHVEVRDVLQTINPKQLTATLSIPWARYFRGVLGREPEQVTMAESCVQVAMHTTHHRPQIARHFRALGGNPPIVDYIAWLWLGRPVVVWPSA